MKFQSPRFMGFEVCIFRISPTGEERATCNYVVSVRRGFLFLLMLMMGYVIQVYCGTPWAFNLIILVGILSLCNRLEIVCCIER